MEAVILAGGFATRLYPLTRDRAKPLLPVAGRPAVEWIFERLFALAKLGLTRIHVVTSERFAEDFRRTLCGPYPIPVEIVSNGVQTSEDKLGAVGDMMLGVSRVSVETPCWVLAGDNLFDFSLVEATRSFSGKPLAVLYRTATAGETREFNNITLGDNGEILDFVEKPVQPVTSLFATCIYLFPPCIRKRLEAYLTAGNDPDKAGHFIQWLAKEEAVYTVEPAGTWFDIGSTAELAEADAYFANL